MKKNHYLSNTLVGLALACALAACGGGTNTTAGAAAGTTITTSDAGAPLQVGDIAIDGKNWINFRRTQAGVPVMTANAAVSVAAQAHSNYQKVNNIVSHDEISGKSGFTGNTLLARLTAANYAFTQTKAYAYGEVISATQNSSGAYMADELVTAIYHRFVMFDPMFKEIGTGAATTSAGYSYFTADFTANNGYGAGIGKGAVITWPFSGQTNVTANFFSDYEAPDPVPDVNEVGYPVSVHADLTAVLAVTSFTIRQHGGGADLSVKLLQHSTDAETPASAAAIIPLAVLKAATLYDVVFTGTADGVAVTKTWSFTTK